MTPVTFTDPHRRKHFDFFRKMDRPHFGLTANVDITHLLATVRAAPELRFTPAVVYLLTRAAHAVPALRYRIRGEGVVEHPTVRPSFTVPTRASSVFSFCTVPYDADALTFHRRAVATIERMQTEPSLEDEPGADDYLFLSAIPWVSFTAVTHAMHDRPPDSVPRITWGKYFAAGDRQLMPLAVQAHHAVVDGSHLGAYYRLVQELLDDSAKIFAPREQ